MGWLKLSGLLLVIKAMREKIRTFLNLASDDAIFAPPFLTDFIVEVGTGLVSFYDINEVLYDASLSIGVENEK